MSLRVTLGTIAALLATAVLVFFAFERELAGAWFTFGVHPEVLGLLERSLDDEKRLARADPVRAPEYRRRFEATAALLGRLRILAFNREELVRRYEILLLGLFAGILTLGSAVYALHERRSGLRLERLQGALAALAAGGVDVRVGEERRRDVIGRIAAMIEATSRAVARDRRPGADPGRERLRQGVGRPGAPRRERPAGGAVRADQLRGDPRLHQKVAALGLERPERGTD